MHKVSDHINSFQLPVCTTNSNFLLDITVMSPTAITSLWNNTFHNHSVLSHSALNGCAESCCAGKVLRGIVGQTLSRAEQTYDECDKLWDPRGLRVPLTTFSIFSRQRRH